MTVMYRPGHPTRGPGERGGGRKELAPRGGSTVTVTGNNFEYNVGYPLCGTTSFTTDHLRFRLMAHYPPAGPGASASEMTVVVQDVPMGWTFSK